ncbi:MAG: CoA pyrophosphatase [Bacteroidales bacterium]
MSINNTCFGDFVNSLKTELTKELPGFGTQKTMSPSIREDLLGNTQPNVSTRQSAVLILLFPSDNKTCTLFIKRPVYDGPHSGQVSFPGGKLEEIDLSIFDTALRETQEEVGVEPSLVEIIGKLTPLYIPVSNSMVHPVIGTIKSVPITHPNLQEVEYPFFVPLSCLLNPANKSIKVISSHGRPISAPYYNVSNEMIWGATAMILAEFLEIVKRIS